MESLGKYRIVEKIGAGGFGEVYKGHDPFIKRFVAIKTCVSDDQEIRNRFFQEAEIAGNLHHRNVTTVYDFGIEDGLPYLIQEYLSGEDLHRKIKRKDFIPYPEKLFYLIQIARGLAYAHTQGVIHRDIKPSNIRILEDGTAKIMDFGIARLAQRESTLTKTGMTVGTAAYLAPEQIRGEEISLPTDVFSFGVMAYELLTYQRPFQGEQISAIMYHVLNSDPAPITSLWPAAPQNIVAVITRCLLKQPGQRYRDGQELREALEKVQRDGRDARLADVDESTRPLQRDATAPIASHDTLTLGSTQATRISGRPAPASTTAASPAEVTPRSGQRLDEMEFANPHPDTETEPEIASATSALDPIYGGRPQDQGGKKKLALVVVLALATGLGGWWYGAYQKAEERLEPTVDVAATGPATGADEAPLPENEPAIDPEAAVDPPVTQTGEAGTEALEPTATDNPIPEIAPPPPPEPATVTFSKPSWTNQMRVRFQGKTWPLPVTRTLDAGTYSATFELELPDYRASRQIQVELEAGQKRTIRPAIDEPGSLDVRPLPRRPQGRVLVDGQDIGTTPIRNLTWKPGSYPLEIRPRSEEEDDGGISGMIEILTGQRTIVTFNLDDGTLSSVFRPLRDASE